MKNAKLIFLALILSACGKSGDTQSKTTNARPQCSATVVSQYTKYFDQYCRSGAQIDFECEMNVANEIQSDNFCIISPSIRVAH